MLNGMVTALFCANKFDNRCCPGNKKWRSLGRLTADKAAVVIHLSSPKAVTLSKSREIKKAVVTDNTIGVSSFLCHSLCHNCFMS